MSLSTHFEVIWINKFSVKNRRKVLLPILIEFRHTDSIDTNMIYYCLSATSVGGGFLSGTAEGAATIGLVWTVFPFTIFLGLCLGENLIHTYT